MDEIRRPTIAELKTSLEKQKIQAGKFGQWFGTGRQLINSIVGLIVFLLALVTIIGIAYSIFEEPSAGFYEMLKITVIPLITLMLGYLFGSKDIGTE